MAKKPAKLTVINSTLPSYLKVVTNGSQQLRGLIQIEDQNTPVWNTDSGTILYLDENEEDVSYQLVATPSESDTTVRYSIHPTFSGTGGALPFGLVLDPQTGVISGKTVENILPGANILPFFDEDKPIWDTETVTSGSLKEGSTISTTLLALPVNEGDDVSYQIVQGALPFGLRLERTGELSGTVTELLNQLPLADTQTRNNDRPVWNTLAGSIGIFNERSPVSITVSSSSKNGSIIYSILKGHLPLGLTMNVAGVISGETSEIIIDAEVSGAIDNTRILPIPTWVTERIVPIIHTNEKNTVDYQLQTQHPSVYGDINHTIIRGNLPFGLNMTRDGHISGTISEVLNTVPVSEHNLIEVLPKPTWNTSIGSLGTIEVLTDTNIEVSATSNTTTTLHYSVVRGDLPLGLTLLSDGTIVGEVCEIIRDNTPTHTITLPTYTNKPIWNTPVGLVSRIKENASISASLEAISPIESHVSYHITNGTLPFGIKLLPSGDLTGISEVIMNVVPEELSDEGAPTITNSPEIGSFNINDTVNVQLLADVYEGRTIRGFKIVNGSLPYGLVMSTDGLISGNVNELNTSGGYNFTVVAVDNVGISYTKQLSMVVNVVEPEVEEV